MYDSDTPKAAIGLLTLHLQLFDCTSLKEKRSHIQPILARLRREFNVATGEVGLQDNPHQALLACVTVSSDAIQNQRLLQQIVSFVETHWPDQEVIDFHMEAV